MSNFVHDCKVTPGFLCDELGKVFTYILINLASCVRNDVSL